MPCRGAFRRWGPARNDRKPCRLSGRASRIGRSHLPPGTRRRRQGSLLVAFQMAVTVILLSSAAVLIQTMLELNRVDLPQGAFNANLFIVSGEWNITPLANITGNVQYDDVSEIVGLFMRARWILTPGNDLYPCSNCPVNRATRTRTERGSFCPVVPVSANSWIRFQHVQLCSRRCLALPLASTDSSLFPEPVSSG